MNLEVKVKWAERKNKNQNPLDFFRENYDFNTTRGQLRSADKGLYYRLWDDGLLNEIPNSKRIIEDSLEYYKQNYKGLTRGKLAIKDNAIYKRLRREGFLGKIPISNRIIENPLKYYKKHYKGLARCELFKKDQSLYQRLRRDGLLKKIPLKKRK